MAILLKITIRGSNQFFSLNSAEYSSYPYEEEVLMQEGIKYRVLDIDEMTVKQLVGDQEVDTKVAVIKLDAIGDKYSQMNCCRRGIHYLTNWARIWHQVDWATPPHTYLSLLHHLFR